MKTAPKRSLEMVLLILGLITTTLACSLMSLMDGKEDEVIPLGPEEAQPQNSDDAQGSEDILTCIPGIFVGKSDRASVIAALGEPIYASDENGYEVMEFDSGSKGQPDVVYLQDGLAILVRKIYPESEPLDWSALQTRLGQPPFTAYSDYTAGSLFFAYPEKGIKVIADPDLDVVFLKECFPPMTLEAFIQSEGQYFPQDDPFTK
jgi:hypothetical protein